MTDEEREQLRTSHWSRARLAQANREAERLREEVLEALGAGRSPELDPRAAREITSSRPLWAPWRTK
jgi:hypothetical protein